MLKIPREHATFATRITEQVFSWKWTLLILSILVTALAFPYSRRLQFDQSIEALFAQESEQLRDFQLSRRQFGGDEIVLVAYRDPDLYDPTHDLFRPERLKVNAALAAELGEVAGISTGQTQDWSALISRSQPLKRIPRMGEIDRRVRDISRGIVLGIENDVTAIVLRFIPQEKTLVSRGETIRQIREIAQRFAAREQLSVHVVGEAVQVHDMFQFVEDDGTRLGFWSAGLLLLVIFGLFRNIRWTILPVAVVGVTVIWTRAVLSVLGLQLSMVSSMLTSLITIIGVATVIHITVRYQELRSSLQPPQTLIVAVCQLNRAILWTCLTTAAGFAAQLSSHIQPVASFGLMMTLGTVLVLPAIAMILPGGALIGPLPIDPHETPGSKWVQLGLSGLSRWVNRKPRQVAGVLGVLTVLGIWGCSRLTIETDFSRNFREDSPILQALDFVEGNLGGAGSWEVNFAAPDQLTEDYLKRVGALANSLRQLRDPNTGEPPLTKVLAVTDGIEMIPQVPLVIPNLQAQVRWLGQLQPDFLKSLYNPREMRMRIVLRSHERKRAGDKLWLINEVERLARSAFPADTPVASAHSTGLHVLLAYLTDSLLGDQWVSFILAGGAILSMMTFAYRSLRVGVISIVPNLLAIGVVIGVMGVSGLPINIGTAMIASVAMGLTVDSSIHFLEGLRRELAVGDGFANALDRTSQDVGSALLYANLALVAGFMVLTLSNFIPLVYFGILSSVAMFGGLLGNLVVLPFLLRLTGGWKQPPGENQLD